MSSTGESMALAVHATEAAWGGGRRCAGLAKVTRPACYRTECLPLGQQTYSSWGHRQPWLKSGWGQRTSHGCRLPIKWHGVVHLPDQWGPVNVGGPAKGWSVTTMLQSVRNMKGGSVEAVARAVCRFRMRGQRRPGERPGW